MIYTVFNSCFCSLVLTPLCVLCVNRTRQKVLLAFDGLDAVASVWLSGVIVGNTDNMFRRYVC